MTVVGEWMCEATTVTVVNGMDTRVTIANDGPDDVTVATAPMPLGLYTTSHKAKAKAPPVTLAQGNSLTIDGGIIKVSCAGKASGTCRTEHFGSHGGKWQSAQRVTQLERSADVHLTSGNDHDVTVTSDTATHSLPAGKTITVRAKTIDVPANSKGQYLF
ncbi:MAG: hypothetical protein RBU37_18550 [Myxococcota bacterium]|jgi:hypothetical protein|nr:hypothetical protein [Myxococcota bacterium]